MKKLRDYIKLFWYFAVNWNPGLAAFMIYHEVRGEKKYRLNTTQPAELNTLTIVNGDMLQGSRYEAVNYYILEQLLGRLTQVTEPYNFVDLGCGKGRAMVVAAHYGFTEIKGIDFATEVCKKAEENMRTVAAEFPIHFQVLNEDVLNYNITENDTVFFMFNPFSKEVLTKFLEKIEASLEQYPRIIHFVYASPRFVEVFFEFEYDVIYRRRKLKWLDGVILEKNPFITYGGTTEEDT